MRTNNSSLLACLLLVGSAGLTGCNSQQAPVAKDSLAKPTGLHTKATTKQLMTWILEPNSDIVWAAVGSVTTEKGEQQTAPKTDAEWQNVRNAAATVAEAGNLLLVAPHVREGDDWAAMVRTMIDEANKSVEAAEAKDIDGVFTAGGDLYTACTACHAKYVIAQQAAGGDKAK